MTAWHKSKVSVFWLSIAVIAAMLLWFRLQLSFDLSIFFPHKSSLSHDILLEQMKDGPGSRLLVIGLNGADDEQLEIISGQLKQQLAEDKAFINVMNGDFEVDEVQIPAPLDRYYLLLADYDYSEPALHAAFVDRQRDLAFGGGSGFLKLMARDPYLKTLEILQRLAPVSRDSGVWFAPDGSAVLLAETVAGSIDIAAQAVAIESAHTAFDGLADKQGVTMEITGVGAFGVELQNTIKAEAQKRTLLAGGVLLIVLLLVYRRPRYLLLASLPISMGFLVGLAVVSTLFGSVHGITLAFGFTLMGVAIDYPLHLFSHARHSNGQQAINSIWPTLRLGALSTAIAYIAISLSGSSGLAQLGVFTACGVAVAALVTRTWLPLFLGNQSAVITAGPEAQAAPKLLLFPAIVVLAMAVAGEQFLLKDGLWEDSLGSLSPISAEKLQHDGMLRSAAGTTDMRYQLVLHAPELQQLLSASEFVDALLQDAVDDGILGSWQSVTQLLPSQQTQHQRAAAIPEPAVLHRQIQNGLQGTAFKADAFAAFEANAAATQNRSLLGTDEFKGTQLGAWLDSHLIKMSGQWVALITLTELDPAALAQRIKSWQPEATLVDLQESSKTLVRDYRNGALTTLAVASILILALLFFGHRQWREIAWIALTVAAALATAVVVVSLAHGGLTIIHLVALLLVLGLGLDYSLFLSRQESTQEQGASRHAVLACALTTTLTFAILAVSSIPVLKFLGLTVAVGSAANYLLAVIGSGMWRSSNPD